VAEGHAGQRVQGKRSIFRRMLVVLIRGMTSVPFCEKVDWLWCWSSKLRVNSLVDCKGCDDDIKWQRCPDFESQESR